MHFVLSRTAVKRVINCVKNTIMKHRDNVMRKQSIEKVAEKLQTAAAATIDVMEKSVEESPKRVCWY